MAKAEPNPTTRGAARSGNREAVVGNVRLRQVFREWCGGPTNSGVARSCGGPRSAPSGLRGLAPIRFKARVCKRRGEQRQRNCRQRKNAVFQIAFRQILREKQSPS